MIGDLADNLRREGIAEEVDAEEIDGDRGGADGGRDGVNDCGIERACVEEEKELRTEKRRYRKASRPEEEQYPEGEREGNAPETEQVKSAVIGA